jgi:Pyruvate dehydrogenase complex, dehydrogenase (E1) component
VYAAFKAAREHTGQPTVILAHTIKGWTLGKDFEARNATHQMKKLTVAELKEFRDRLYLPIGDSALEAELPPYYHPGEDSDEIQYMRERRAALGGVLPRRVVRAKSLRSRPTRPTRNCARARASRPWPPRWRSSGCSRS